jgi:hypothetical protein
MYLILIANKRNKQNSVSQRMQVPTGKQSVSITLIYAALAPMNGVEHHSRIVSSVISYSEVPGFRYILSNRLSERKSSVVPPDDLQAHVPIEHRVYPTDSFLVPFS